MGQGAITPPPPAGFIPIEQYQGGGATPPPPPKFVPIEQYQERQRMQSYAPPVPRPANPIQDRINRDDAMPGNTQRMVDDVVPSVQMALGGGGIQKVASLAKPIAGAVGRVASKVPADAVGVAFPRTANALKLAQKIGKTFGGDAAAADPWAELPQPKPVSRPAPAWKGAQPAPTELTVDTTPSAPYKPNRAPAPAAPQPVSRPRPAWQQPNQPAGRELTVDTSPMQPYKPNRARPEKLIDQVINAKDVTPALTGKSPQYPPERGGTPFELGVGSPKDIQETRGIQEQIRDAADSEERMRLKDAARQWFANNDPSTPKSVLTGQADKPVKYTKTKPTRSARLSDKVRQAAGSSTSEDLSGEWQKSVDFLKAKKGQQ